MRRPPGSTLPGVALRPAREEDLPACLDTWHAALEDYGVRVGRPPMPRSYGQLAQLLGHALATDPERFWVATRPATAGGAQAEGRRPGATSRPDSEHIAGERVVGFVSAVVRGDVWYLAMLFVRPGEQAAGLGTALLDRVLPADGTGLVRATCTDSAQPIANALYGRLGMVPRVPVQQLVGRPEREPLPGLPRGIRAVRFGDVAAGIGGDPAAIPGRTLEALDRAILGYARLREHDLLLRSGRHGFLYLADGGRALGYGYVAASGRLGPVALEDPDLGPGVLGHLVRAIDPPGAFLAWVPGSFAQATVALLRAGLRLEDFPALLCWDRAFASFDRYLPLSLAIL